VSSSFIAIESDDFCIKLQQKKNTKILSTETVKKAVGIIKNPFEFNQVNKIKHYFLIF